jgi:hypothetical protein
MRDWTRFVGKALCIGSGLLTLACGEPNHPSQFGHYPAKPTLAILPSGDTLFLYRIRYWQLDGRPTPSLHIEFESPWSLGDTGSVRKHLDETWKYFSPYADSLGLTTGILTATVIDRGHRLFVPTTVFRHFGAVFDTASFGGWRDDDVLVVTRRDPGRVTFIAPDGSTRAFLDAAPATEPVRGVELQVGKSGVRARAGYLGR